MQQIADWLKSLGMSEYAQRFAENDIDFFILQDLSDQDLEKIGVRSLGHRRKMLRAIADLKDMEKVAPAVAVTDAASAVPRPLASAERRHVTVMFCDLVGSTALSARLDPEDLRGIIGTYHRCCAEVVERNGGFVAKYLGDGVLAYFGYPQAHEHDAERAVRAGLALVEEVPKLEATAAGGSLQVRVGIATGLVVVGDLIGSGEAQERGIVGETPNLAARLQGIAEPNTVVIANGTRRLIGNLFELEDLGPKDLKGIAGPARAWAALRTSSVESRFEALHTTGLSALVGRDEEIDLLMRRWEQAKRGDGSIVLLSGEPGIGKSRIAQTVLERLAGEPHTRLRYFCSPHHQDSALYPSITQLERAAGVRREDSDTQRLDKLEAVLSLATNELREAVPLLADLLSIPVGDRYPSLNLTPQKRKEKTLHAQLAQVEGLAGQQPVLMVFEDLHWSDPTTRESLDLLIDRVPALRVLVIITFRPEFAPPWVGRPQVTLLSLSRLPPRRRAEMIMQVTGGKALPREIADEIVDRTDGVPLFIEELTKTVVESGILTEAGDHYTATGSIAPLAIPASLHASLLARLDRLAPTREVAQIGAALGRQFSHELISAVAQMPQQQLDDALAQLLSAELIFRRGTPPDAEYTFKHALVQDTAYSTLLRSRRRQIHARIASTLEDHFPEIVQKRPEVSARHCAEAGSVEKAVGYWLKAGRHATARSAMNEAVAQLRNGLELLSSIPDGATRQKQELDLQIALGHALIATKGLAAPEAGEAFDRAHQLCKQSNPSPQLGPILRGQFNFRLFRGELEQAEHHAAEIRHLGEVQNDVMWKCIGALLSGNVSLWLGRFIEAAAHYENALSLWDPKFRTSVESPTDPYVAIVSHLSRTLISLGHLDRARLLRDEAVTEARRVSPYNLAFALSNGWLGDWPLEGRTSAQTIIRFADELLALSGEQGFLPWLGIANVMQGWCLSTEGKTAEGIPLILQGLAIYRATGAKLVSAILLMIAEAYVIARNPREGLDQLAEAAALIETTHERWAKAEMHRLRGMLLLSMHEHAAAEDSYRQALAVARRQSAKLWELRAATSLARLWRDQGQHTEARDLLAPVYGWFTEGFDTPILQEAKTLLEKLTA